MSEQPTRETTQDGTSGIRCDFCGAHSPRVRRVALDSGYDRLQVRHTERYACPDCSEKKERQRVGH